MDNEDINMEKKMENSREIKEGMEDVWTYDNHNNLVNEFIEDYNEMFRNFCKMRFKEAHD